MVQDDQNRKKHAYVVDEEEATGPGANRYGAWKNLDIRLEKEFATSGRKRFGISLDVFNLLGEKYRIFDLDAGGTWRPDGEGASTGTRVLSGTYNTYWPRWGTGSSGSTST